MLTDFFLTITWNLCHSSLVLRSNNLFVAFIWKIAIINVDFLIRFTNDIMWKDVISN